MGTKGFFILSAAAVSFATACATQVGPNDATAEQGDVDTLGTITSVNADGTWTATADQPIYNGTAGTATARANFTGPTGKTRKMGVCLLMQYGSLTSATPCTTVTDCANAPTTLPTGGSRYCMAPDGQTQKNCYYRPGSQTGYCGGSPANGGLPIAPQYVYAHAGAVTSGSVVISDACFEGCSATDPSVSSVKLSIQVSGGSCFCNGRWQVCSPSGGC